MRNKLQFQLYPKLKALRSSAVAQAAHLRLRHHPHLLCHRSGQPDPKTLRTCLWAWAFALQSEKQCEHADDAADDDGLFEDDEAGPAKP